MQFKDRHEAGRLLGLALLEYVGADALVVGLARGGVPVAVEVARVLEAPLDLWVVRKLGVPFRPELGMGAIAEGPALYLDRNLVATLRIESDDVMAVVRREADELRRRVALYRAGRSAPDVHHRTWSRRCAHWWLIWSVHSSRATCAPSVPGTRTSGRCRTPR
jgi:putative phosphoribosyl transferase